MCVCVCVSGHRRHTDKDKDRQIKRQTHSKIPVTIAHARRAIHTSHDETVRDREREQHGKGEKHFETKILLPPHLWRDKIHEQARHLSENHRGARKESKEG